MADQVEEKIEKISLPHLPRGIRVRILAMAWPTMDMRISRGMIGKLPRSLLEKAEKLLMMEERYGRIRDVDENDCVELIFPLSNGRRIRCWRDETCDLSECYEWWGVLLPGILNTEIVVPMIEINGKGEIQVVTIEDVPFIFGGRLIGFKISPSRTSDPLGATHIF